MMYIEALEKVNTMSHSLEKGDVVNMRGVDAQKLINEKKARELTIKEIKAIEAKTEKAEK